MRRRRLSPRPSGSLRTACLGSRPPVRGRAPSRHLPGPTPSQRPPALGPSAEAALPPVRGLKWLRNKENLGSGERRSDWTGGGARRGNVRRRSPWQRRRGWENRGRGTGAQGPAPGGAWQRFLSPRCSLGPRASGLGPLPGSSSRLLRPARGPEPGAQEEPLLTLHCTVRPRPKWPCKCGCLRARRPFPGTNSKVTAQPREPI